jgi:hypothetical protein
MSDSSKHGVHPSLPPGPGWWLSKTIGSDFRTVSHVRQIADVECELLSLAAAHFRDVPDRPEVSPLLRQYSHWQGALKSGASSRYMGPTIEGFASRALEQFLPMWRMALDVLRQAIADKFGKNSEQMEAFDAARRRAYDRYFGYRLIEALRNAYLHQGPPSLRQDVTFTVIHCERCGEQHKVDPVLIVEVPREYLLASKTCPATIKRDLADRSAPYVDLRAAIAEAMRGFWQVLFAFALTPPSAAAWLHALIAVWAEGSTCEVPELAQTI